MIIANIITYCILLLGGLNWLLVGVFNWNLVGAIMGGNMAAGAIVIYILVGLSAIWLIISPFITHGILKISDRDKR